MKTKIYNLAFLLLPCAFLSLQCCKKTETAPTSYTKQMAGNHVWYGKLQNFDRYGGKTFDTVYDVSYEFEIVVIDDEHILTDLSIDTLKFTHYDPSLKTLTYIHNYYSTYSSKFSLRYDSLTYFYENKLIKYYVNNSTTFYGNILDLHTP